MPGPGPKPGSGKAPVDPRLAPVDPRLARLPGDGSSVPALRTNAKTAIANPMLSRPLSAVSTDPRATQGTLL